MAVTKDFTASASLNGNTITYILRVTENSTNTAANTSNITVKAILKQSWNGYLFGDWHTGVSCTINGSQKFSDYTQRTLNGTGEHVYYTWTGDIAHNSDGSLSLKVGGKVWQNTPTYFVSNGITISESSSNKLELTDIPRASSVSVSSSSKKPGESQTITISRASSSFTDTVTWSCGSKSGTIATKSSSTSHSWTVPMDLIKQSPNGNQTCTITTTTYNGNTVVGSKSTTFTVGYYSPSTISATSGTTIGSAVSITISRANSGFTHSLWWSFGADTWNGIGSGIGTSTSFTPNTALFAAQIPSATSGTMTLICRTYYGSTQIGSDTTKAVTMNLPSSITPTIGTPTITINNPSAASDWGLVAGLSTLTVAIPSSGTAAGSGSTIKSYSISGGGFSGSSNSLTTGKINGTNPITFTCTVTDARGRTASKTITSATPVSYSAPSITIKNAYRATQSSSGGITKDSNSTGIAVELEYTYSSIGGKNTISRSVKANSATNTSFSSGSTIYLAAGAALTNTCTITAAISDELGNSDDASFVVYTASRAVNIKKDKDGVAFGGFATESNVANFFWTIKQGGVSLIDIFYPVGSIYESVNSTNPSSFMGGTWEAFGAGRVTVGINTSDSNFNTVKKTGGSSTFNNAHTHTMAHTHTINSHTHTMAHTHSINGHTHTTGNHTLTVDQIPAHTHYPAQENGSGTLAKAWYNRSAYNKGSYGASTSSTGGGKAHNHGNTGSTSLTTNASSAANTGRSGSLTSNAASSSTTSSNGSSSQSLLQPYIVVYRWVRTA